MCLTALLIPCSAQQTIHVPQDVSTIQGGIDAASNGDTVFVAPGTYNENIDFHGKIITLTSGGTSFTDTATTSTIINGTQDGPVVTFDTGETSAAVLNGFTIQNGHSSVGASLPAAGVWISGASPTISNNLIINNTGNGILLTNLGNVTTESNSLIQGNDIRNTTSVPQTGVPGGPGNGLVISTLGNIQVIGNTIEGNTVSPVSSSNEGTVGGGVYITGFVLGHTFPVLLKDNIIRKNRAPGGAGVFAGGLISPPSLTLIQNLIYDNTDLEPAPDGNYYGQQVEIGGTLWSPYPSLTEINNTIYGPGNPEELLYSFGASVIENNIFFNGEDNPYTDGFPGENSGLWCADNFATGSPLTINNNDLYNVGQLQDGGCNLGSNNLSADPQFVNAATDDFHTQPTSPVVAAGTTSAPDIPSADLDAKAREVFNTIDVGVYEVRPHPPMTLTVTPNPAPGQSTVTLTVTLTGNCNMPTGTVVFLDGTTMLGSAPINSSGVATFSTSFLYVGTHNLVATYAGDFNFDNSTSNTVTEVITGPPTTTILNSVSPNPALPLQSITMTATVSSAYTVPAGTITFMAGGTALATANVAANGTASVTISTLGVGTYSITAVYGGSTEYAGSTSNTVVEVVNQAPTTSSLTSAPNPSGYGQTVTFTATVAASQSTTPIGPVTFSDGSTVLGSAPLNASGQAVFSTASLAPGTHTITASYGGSSNFEKSGASVTQIVTLIPTTTGLTASPNPAGQGQTVTLTASVSATGATPAGTVTFDDDGTSIGTATLNAAGVAVFTASNLSIGLHNFTAVYSADGRFGGSASPTVHETIVAAGFALSVTPAILTLRLGQSGTVEVNLDSFGAYTGTIGLSVTSLPQYVTGVFNPSSTTVQETGTTQSILTISTPVTPPSKAQSDFSNHSERVLSACVALLFLSSLWRRRRRWPALLFYACGVFTVGSTTGCGGIVEVSVHAATPGTYVVPITATDSAGATRSSQLTLVITS